jgi:thiamine biosynthesis lipoprotein
MSVSDPPPGAKGWKVELSSVTTNTPKEFVLIKDCGLATSGDMWQRLEIDGKRYSHIVDPHTGIGLTDHSLVTVIAKDATTADGLSKPVSVLGPERGLKLIKSFRGASVRIVRQPKENVEVVISHNFDVHTNNLVR